MNERIQELYEQSRIGYGLGYDMEKFVELIVRECANIDYKNASDGEFSNDDSYLISKVIKHHFGVEE